jgi:glycosyltransferase involved in cell wall biosynthesis
MNPCLAIPIFDHGGTIAGVVESLSKYDLPCLIVDDGSGEATRQQLDLLEERYPWVEVVHHPRNLGRGAALRTAYESAAARGHTHVIQLDADGQHDSADVSQFLQAAKAQPDALILGTPIFDESIPWHRLHGRKLSQGIVWLETLSKSVRDPLCGFRCIPLARTLEVLARADTGDRMDFDPELIIRLVRAGVPVVNLPTRVQYPVSGISHFRMVEDNLRIAWAYIRLAFRLPRSGGAASRDDERRNE